jgi:hypothetical protein
MKVKVMCVTIGYEYYMISADDAVKLLDIARRMKRLVYGADAYKRSAPEDEVPLCSTISLVDYEREDRHPARPAERPLAEQPQKIEE